MFQDPRFNKEIDKKTGYRTRSLLCMPILNYEGDVVGVAQIINKADPHIQEFTEQDEEVSETETETETTKTKLTQNFVVGTNIEWRL